MPEAREPAPQAGIDLDRLLGAWHIIATTLPFWRGRSEPTVTYTRTPEGRWLDEVRFIGPPFRRRWHVVGENTLAAPPGRFDWRGTGLLRFATSRWCFVAVAQDASWAATWFSRVTAGITPEGWDLYARDPAFPKAAALAAMTEVRRVASPPQTGWFFTESMSRPYGAAMDSPLLGR